MYIYINISIYLSIYLYIFFSFSRSSDLLEARVCAGEVFTCQLQCRYTYLCYLSIYPYLTCQLQRIYTHLYISIYLYLTCLKLASAPIQSLPASYNVDIHI